MNANAYSEDQMIQVGTAHLFAEHLDWRSEYAFDRAAARLVADSEDLRSLDQIRDERSNKTTGD
jgi:hypothetical protein